MHRGAALNRADVGVTTSTPPGARRDVGSRRARSSRFSLRRIDVALAICITERRGGRPREIERVAVSRGLLGEANMERTGWGEI